MEKQLAGAASLMLACSLTSPAWGQDASETHDGLYVRGGAGFGALDIKRKADPVGDNQAYDSSSDADASANAFELSIGTTAMEGFVIGGKAQAWISEDHYDFMSVRGGDTVYKRMFFGYAGIMVDWYPSEDGGWHLGGTLGIAHLKLPTVERSTVKEVGGFGGTFAAHFGYDIWIMDQGSLGIALQVLDSRMSDSATIDGVESEAKNVIRGAALMVSYVAH